MAVAIKHKNWLRPEAIRFFDAASNTFSYIIKGSMYQLWIMVDSVLDFDYASGIMAHKPADKIIEYIEGIRTRDCINSVLNVTAQP